MATAYQGLHTKDFIRRYSHQANKNFSDDAKPTTCKQDILPNYLFIKLTALKISWAFGNKSKNLLSFKMEGKAVSEQRLLNLTKHTH